MTDPFEQQLRLLVADWADEPGSGGFPAPRIRTRVTEAAAGRLRREARLRRPRLLPRMALVSLAFAGLMITVVAVLAAAHVGPFHRVAPARPGAVTVVAPKAPQNPATKPATPHESLPADPGHHAPATPAPPPTAPAVAATPAHSAPPATPPPTAPAVPASAAPCSGTTVTPATGVQSVIDAAPNGTTFCFAAGTYAVSSLVPKTGDVFDGGNRSAILDGGGTAAYAFYGDSTATGPSGVVVRGFVIRNFATPLQRGAIQDYNGAGWIIQNNRITRNAAAGVAIGDGVQVIDDLIDWNQEEGFSAHGNGGLFRGDEIAYNNYNLAIDPTWEAGGGMAWSTSGLTFKSNYVHDNGGQALQTDRNCIDTTFDGNTITNNWGAGIYYAESYDATITNNVISGNGMGSSPGGGQKNGWLWDAGIVLRLSGARTAASPLLIEHNTITDNYNGIALINGAASGCVQPVYTPCQVQNVLVEDNGITMSQGGTGAVQDGAGNGVFTSQNNRFVGNHYCVASSAHPPDGYASDWFAWMNSWIGWSSWSAYGLDAGGTFSVGGTCVP